MQLLMNVLLWLGSRSLEPTCGLFDLVEHSGSGHHGGGTSDPYMDACAISVLIIGLSTVGMLLFGGPLLAFVVRRVRSLLWMIPSINAGVYLLSDVLRGYPGGRYGRLQTPGIWYTLGEFLVALLLGLIVALVVAIMAVIVRWLVRKVRGPKVERGEAVGSGR